MMTHLNISNDSKLILFELCVSFAGIGMLLNVSCMHNSILSYRLCVCDKQSASCINPFLLHAIC